MTFWKAGLNMTIQFDLSIYSSKAVTQAVKDYESIADIQVEINDSVCSCHFSQSKYDLVMTSDEFSNYVLELSVSQENPNP